MAIRNLMEDVVASVVMEVLSREGKKLSHPDVYYDDIIAYVLNRIPSKYITSERGILHDRIDMHSTVQQRSDILFIVHEALSHVKNRRDSTAHSDYSEISRKSFFFQHIIGEALEETSFNPVPGIEVTLLFGKKNASMIDPTWQNPYLTMKSTRGFFHFWPDFIEGEMDGGSPVEFTLRFSHPMLKTREVPVSLKVVETFNLHDSHVVPITLLQTMDGVDVSFLYDNE